MREIKCQGWDGKKIQQVKQIQFDGDGHTVFWFPTENYPNRFYQNCEDYPIHWFTGLKDCKGKEIYEGDLIRTDGFSDGLSVPVVWRECMFQMGEHGISPLYPRKDYEIVGNIYENPELLKERK